MSHWSIEHAESNGSNGNKNDNDIMSRWSLLASRDLDLDLSAFLISIYESLLYRWLTLTVFRALLRLVIPAVEVASVRAWSAMSVVRAAVLGDVAVPLTALDTSKIEGQESTEHGQYDDSNRQQRHAVCGHIRERPGIVTNAGWIHGRLTSNSPTGSPLSRRVSFVTHVFFCSPPSLFLYLESRI